MDVSNTESKSAEEGVTNVRKLVWTSGLSSWVKLGTNRFMVGVAYAFFLSQ